MNPKINIRNQKYIKLFFTSSHCILYFFYYHLSCYFTFPLFIFILFTFIIIFFTYLLLLLLFFSNILMWSNIFNIINFFFEIFNVFQIFFPTCVMLVWVLRFYKWILFIILRFNSYFVLCKKKISPITF